LSLAVALGLAITGSTSAGAFALLAAISLASSLIGRALFFVPVIPTTMPGAYFWKNAGFIEHAREIGLAEMPQLGVVREQHHPFRLDELIETIRTFALPLAGFEGLIDARVFDLYDDQMPTQTDLEGYCGETASALIQLAAIAIRMGATKEQFDATCAVHPTMAEELVTMKVPVRTA